MRWLILSIIWMCSLNCRGQVVQLWIGDTAQVRIHSYLDDTNYYWKQYRNLAECYIYYDEALTHKAAYYKYGKYNCDVDSIWFRNGKVRKWKVAVPNCALCWTIREWYPSGALKLQCNYSNDTCTWTHYYESGKLKELNKDYHDTSDFGNDLSWHYRIEFFENGQKKFDAVNPNLHIPQPYIDYYESGEKMSEGMGYSHQYTGPYISWYKTGQTKVKGNYSEIVRGKYGLPESNKIGTWSYYNESGKLIKEEFYEEGKLVKTVEY